MKNGEKRAAYIDLIVHFECPQCFFDFFLLSIFEIYEYMNLENYHQIRNPPLL